MILYILAGIILVVVLFFIYIRLKYRFWAIQPVYHYYDIQYWFYNKGIIRNELPEKNKYVNLKQIWSKDFSKLTNYQKKEALTLIQYNYLRNKNGTKYYPQDQNIYPYFDGHFAPSYWTFFHVPNTLIDTSNKTINDKLLTGIITSRPLHVQINTSIKHYFDIYYVDYLCIEKSSRKKGIAQQLIQTHEYNQSHNNKKIVVSLFKREEELTGIVPLVAYNTYAFSTKKWINKPKLSHKYTILTGDKQNLYYFYNFIRENSSNWNIIIWPEISNIISLIETGNIIIKMIMTDTEILSAYLFRKTCTKIEGSEALDCFASINIGLSNDDFINGFKVALQSILQKYSNYGYLMIEDITNNNIIINNLQIKTHPYAISPTAYFFYNFAYSTFPSNKCLIIN